MDRGMKRIWKTPLGREISLILLVKLGLIVTLKLVFFSDAVKPDSTGVARALLESPARSQGVPTHE